MPPRALQWWLFAIAIALFVTLLALIANAQRPSIFNPIPEMKLEVYLTEDDQGEWLIVEFENGRIISFRTSAVTMVSYYPPGHELGEPMLSVVEIVCGTKQQRLVIADKYAKELLDEGPPHKERTEEIIDDLPSDPVETSSKLDNPPQKSQNQPIFPGVSKGFLACSESR